MKAELIPEETFTLKVGTHQVPGMRVVSKWNGLIELRNARDEVLIVSMPDRYMHPTFGTLFNDVFRTALETKEAGAVIVMGSPDLLMRLRAAAVPEAGPRGYPKV